jgi:hypothetical protein
MTKGMEPGSDIFELLPSRISGFKGRVGHACIFGQIDLTTVVRYALIKFLEQADYGRLVAKIKRQSQALDGKRQRAYVRWSKGFEHGEERAFA